MASAITSTSDETVFDFRLEAARHLIKQYAESFTTYFESRILSLLTENKEAQQRHPDCNLINWTNNNCESLNAVIKHAIHWRPQQMQDLVLVLYKLVQSQHKEVERSLVGVGDMQLAPEFKKHAVPLEVWCTKSEAQRETIVTRFYKKTMLKNARFQSTSDGLGVVVTPSHGGKKPDQVKRKRCAKT